MLYFFKKDDQSKYSFISTLDLILLLALIFFVIILLPVVILILYPPFLNFLTSNLFVVYLIFSLFLSFLFVYYFCCKKRNKNLSSGLFLTLKSKDVYVKSVIVGIIMPVLTAPILIGAAPEDFYAAEVVKSFSGIIFIILTATFVAIFEEIFFRGIIFSFVQSKANSFWAIVISAILFGLAHFKNIGNSYALISLFILYGLVLSYVRYKTSSVIPAIITHLTHNYSLILGFLILKILKFN